MKKKKDIQRCPQCGSEVETDDESCLQCGKLLLIDEDYDAYANEMNEEDA